MACPDCGSPTGEWRFARSVETHGLDCGPYETFNEEFMLCGGCGGRFDVCDWDGTPELQLEVDVAQDPIKTASIPAESAPGQLIRTASYGNGRPDRESGQQLAPHCDDTMEIRP